jgi:hypothetical protein
MADARFSEAMLERIRRHRRLEADRQQAAASIAIGGFFQSPEGSSYAEALTSVTSLMRSLGTPMPEVPRDLAQEDKFLPPPCTAAEIDAASEALGFAIPAALQQLYLEVGDGGFGPCNGTFELERVVREYLDLTDEPAGPKGELWPANLLPIADLSPGFTCLDLATGQIVDWDPGELGEGEGEAAWQASFAEAAPDLITWLTLWLDEPL